MSSLSVLSRRERQIMEVVFRRGEATLTTILDEIGDAPTRAALRSILHILEEKGHLSHRKQGREFLYYPTHSRESEGRSALSRLLHTFYNGSLGKALAAQLSSPDEDYSQEEIDDLIRHLESAKKERRDSNRKNSNKNNR